MATYFLYFLVLIVFFLVGNLLSTTFKLRQSLFSNLWLGLLTCIVSIAILFTGFSTIFIGVLVILLYHFYCEGFKLRKPEFDFNHLKINSLIKFFVFASFFFLLFYLAGGQLGTGQSLHHDFLYYIDVSWYLEKTGIETLVTNPIEVDKVFPSAYHYFIPWLLVALKTMSFNSILSYELLLNLVFPLLASIVFLGVLDLLAFFKLELSWRTWVLALIPFLCFGIFLTPYLDFSLLKYGDRFINGIFNSYWSGKLLVSALILIPLFLQVLKQNFSGILINLGLLCFVSIINLPVALILMVVVTFFEFYRRRKLKSLMVNTAYLTTIFLFFQGFYSGSEFIPQPSLFLSVKDFFLNGRTSVILITENLIQCFVIFLPMVLIALIFFKRIKALVDLKNLFQLVVLVVISSSAIWVLLRGGFGSSEFFKLVGTSWVNLFVGLVIILLINQLTDESKWLKVSFLALTIIGLFLYSFVQVDSRLVDSYSNTLYDELKEQDFEGQLILSFISPDKEFKNLPGQFNPFVHYNMNVLYQISNDFSIVSGSNLLSENFANYLKDAFAETMLKQDPLYIYSLQFKDMNNEEIINQFIAEFEVKYLVFDAEYEIPRFLSDNVSRVVTDQYSGCKLLIYR